MGQISVLFLCRKQGFKLINLKSNNKINDFLLTSKSKGYKI